LLPWVRVDQGDRTLVARALNWWEPYRRGTD